MNKEFERYLIVFLLLILIGLSGCVSKQVTTTNNPKLPEATQESTNDSDVITGVSNVPNIVHALTCMFSPDTCDSVKEERKMDR
jgi:PBP1b-binding outer membrane lipoprotein LpoB